ncbi:MAG TPA: BlaI/MecI/CopY family transcriptional regulator [Dermatophilaceae bacterium]|nr:BlaI/MecI/CopY family transcriptional regulator [Dermatophilaceae bacterium]
MPVSTSAPRLGDLERAVMDHLWESTDGRGDGATVREVLDRFSGERELAYTTVMTVLDRLSKKSLVTRVRDGRAWRYTPAGSREALTAQTMRRTLDDMDVTDRRTALLHFLDGATASEIADLKAALAEVEARQVVERRSPLRRSRLLR